MALIPRHSENSFFRRKALAASLARALGLGNKTLPVVRAGGRNLG
jgi:hypothetical protein